MAKINPFNVTVLLLKACEAYATIKKLSKSDISEEEQKIAELLLEILLSKCSGEDNLSEPLAFGNFFIQEAVEEDDYETGSSANEEEEDYNPEKFASSREISDKIFQDYRKKAVEFA